MDAPERWRNKRPPKGGARPCNQPQQARLASNGRQPSEQIFLAGSDTFPIKPETILSGEITLHKLMNYQTIFGADGQPAFVVIAYAEFVKNFEQERHLVPDEVVKLALEDGMSPAEAWRTHLELTQADVALRMDVTQSAYAQLEASQNMRKASREKIAAALGISPGQLDF